MFFQNLPLTDFLKEGIFKFDPKKEMEYCLIQLTQKMFDFVYEKVKKGLSVFRQKVHFLNEFLLSLKLGFEQPNKEKRSEFIKKLIDNCKNESGKGRPKNIKPKFKRTKMVNKNLSKTSSEEIKSNQSVEFENFFCEFFFCIFDFIVNV